jgi:hypothetical protein
MLAEFWASAITVLAGVHDAENAPSFVEDMEDTNRRPLNERARQKRKFS